MRPVLGDAGGGREIKSNLEWPNVSNDYNYSEELIESFISESNGGISVFIACTEPKI
jgi:hypothetical protein